MGWDGPSPNHGDALPALFHHLYFWPTPGAPLVTFPKLGLPRRVAAGGKFVFHAPLRLGITAEKASILRGTARKTGQSGPLALVTFRHEVRQRGALVLTEDQEFLFCEALYQDSAIDAEQSPSQCLPIQIRMDDVFRYSALTMTYNPVCLCEEAARKDGYSAPVVQAAFLAIWLARLAQSRIGALTQFQYRTLAPLYVDEPCELCANGNQLWVRGQDRRLIMTAKAA